AGAPGAARSGSSLAAGNVENSTIDDHEATRSAKRGPTTPTVGPSWPGSAATTPLTGAKPPAPFPPGFQTNTFPANLAAHGGTPRPSQNTELRGGRGLRAFGGP